jgi:hypothetical protein
VLSNRATCRFTLHPICGALDKLQTWRGWQHLYTFGSSNLVLQRLALSRSLSSRLDRRAPLQDVWAISLLKTAILLLIVMLVAPEHRPAIGAPSQTNKKQVHPPAFRPMPVLCTARLASGDSRQTDRHHDIRCAPAVPTRQPACSRPPTRLPAQVQRAASAVISATQLLLLAKSVAVAVLSPPEVWPPRYYDTGEVGLALMFSSIVLVFLSTLVQSWLVPAVVNLRAAARKRPGSRLLGGGAEQEPLLPTTSSAAAAEQKEAGEGGNGSKEEAEEQVWGSCPPGHLNTRASCSMAGA